MSAEPVLSTGDVDRLVLDSVRGVRKSAFTPECQERHCLDFKLLVEPPLPSATITDLCNEPLFYSGYLSSEEDMSSDDMSLSSLSSMNEDELFDDFETNFPELLAEDCNFVEQQCNQAEIITLLSPGKAKMVRVSKIDLSSSSLIKRPASSSGHKHVQTSSRLSIVSLRAHSSDGAASSASPTLPSTPDLEAGSRTPDSSNGPATPETPDSSFFDSLSAPSHNMTPTPKPRARNPYRLRLSHMTKRADSVGSFDAPLSAPLAAPPAYTTKEPTRGASERLHSVELPPFRDQLVQPPKSARPWILRRDSFGSSFGKDQTPRYKLRRAESGILPSWK